MFHLYISNHLDHLAEKLSNDLKHQSSSIFQPYTIVTQTEGMSNWLRLKIAEKEGIAAHVKFPKPSEIVEQIYWILGGTKENILKRDEQHWHIYEVLESRAFQSLFPDKALYYNDDPQAEELKKLALSRLLADLFDQYQIYRPQTIRQWNEQGWEAADGKYKWQAYIWEKSKYAAGAEIKDMTSTQQIINEKLKDPENRERLKKRLPYINLFGLSVLTKFHIQILHRVAELIDVNFYLFNPAPEVYWIEDQTEKEILRIQSKSPNKQQEPFLEGNSLLANWGKVLQGTFGMLFQEGEVLNTTENVGLSEPLRNNLLNKIKHDIFHNQTTDVLFTPADLEDGSISIVSSYSKIREVEALYNFIVGLFHDQKIKELKTREILVMVNQIDEYAPYIRSIFANGPLKMPYHIADESIVVGDTPISAFAALLRITEHDCTAENILQLLDFKCIRRCFGIEDVPLITQAVLEARIRFGIENNLQDDSYLVSWTQGLRKIMFGLCMADEPTIMLEGQPAFNPLDQFEGKNHMDQLVRFVAFAEQLFEHLRQRKAKRSIIDWVEFANQSLSQFILATEGEEEILDSLTERLSSYIEDAKNVTLQLNYEVFAQHLLQNLEHSTKAHSFSKGGITFCSQIPMRSIPFKVIAMLGLTFADYPRKDKQFDYDLIREKRQLGDRSTKENDKQLFLETLLSAEEKLYLSYVGKSPKDNSHLPPSILIDELLDYIQSGINNFCQQNKIEKLDVRCSLITQEPLHLFSSKYNKPQSSLRNFLLQAESKRIDLFKEQLPEEAPTELSVNSFLNFCKNPTAYFYHQVLNIYFEEQDYEIPSTESFAMDKLQENVLTRQWIQKILANEDIDEEVQTALRSGELPLKHVGRLSIEKPLTKAQTNAALVRSYVQDQQIESREIDLNIKGCRVVGEIDMIADRSIFAIITNDKVTDKYMIPYVKFLLGAASGQLDALTILFDEQAFSFGPYDKDLAMERLEQLMACLQFSHRHPIPWDYSVYKNLHKDRIDPSKVEEALNKANALYNPYLNDALDKGLFAYPELTEMMEQMHYVLIEEPRAGTLLNLIEA